MQYFHSLGGLLLAVLSFAACAEGASSPDCMRCGNWTVVRASIPSFVSEQLVISREKLTLPFCGSYVYREIGPGRVEGEGIDRVDTMEFELSTKIGDGCPFFAGVRMPVVRFIVYGGPLVEAAGAEVSILSAVGGQRLVDFSVANFDRENPCELGSLDGFRVCYAQSIEQSYRRLAVESRALGTTTRGRIRFDIAEFARTVTRYCQQREKDQLTSLRTEMCEDAVLRSKLMQFYAWRVCLATQGNKCLPPSGAIDRGVEY